MVAKYPCENLTHEIRSINEHSSELLDIEFMLSKYKLSTISQNHADDNKNSNSISDRIELTKDLEKSIFELDSWNEEQVNEWDMI